MTREMNTTHDYRQDAAKTVARRSELALLRLRNARTLAELNEREIAGSAGCLGRGADDRDGTRAGDGAGGAGRRGGRR